MTETEKNEMAESFQAEIESGLDSALNNNPTLNVLLGEKKSLEKERENIAQGIDKLTEELSRIDNELTEKKRALHLNPLKVVKINKEIADLVKLAETTKASIESMGQLINEKDSALARQKQSVLNAICEEHSRAELAFSAKYQEKVDSLLDEALAVCEAYVRVTDTARRRYGIKTNEVAKFPEYRALKMGSCFRFKRYLSLPLQCGLKSSSF